MLKTKGKVLLTLLLTLILGTLFAFAISAADDGLITIEFYTSGNALDKTINTNGIVEGSIQIPRGQSVRLPSKTVATGNSFNWRTDDGRAWEGGSVVKFYENSRLFPVTAIDISTPDELYTQMPKGATVRLLNDMYLEKKPDFPWPGTCTILMNGKTLEMNPSLSYAWGGQRCGTFFYGSGNIKYTGTGVFMNLQGHGWGGDSCRLFVGRGITLDAPNATLGRDGDGSAVQGYPYIQIHGIVNCKTVLEMANAGNRNPRIEIHDGAQLNLNGAFLRHTATGNIIRVSIFGGNITTKSNDSFFGDKNAVFTISGGSFTFQRADDYALLEENIDVMSYKISDLTGSNGTVYKTVMSYETCRHDYKLVYTQAADCNQAIHDNFICTMAECDSHIRLAYGSKTAHSFTTTPTAHKNPTKTSVGWDKYVCSVCSSIKLEYLYYDPSNDPVLVTVNTGNGDETIKATLKDVLVYDSNFCVTGIKAFGTYTLEQIKGIYIPAGIARVNITDTNSYVKSITFGSGIVAEITSIKGLTALENIVIENVAGLVFTKGCAPTTVKSIRSDVGGAKVEYKEGAFLGYSSLTEMTFSKGSSYTFGKQSFKESGVESLNFVDGCSVNFAGEQAFYASKVKYLYVGKGITTLANKPFDCAYYLETIILMDVTTLSTDYTFCCMNKGERPCVVYHHAASLSLGGNTFYQSHGVTVYTQASITTGFASCAQTTKGGVTYPAYTIHYGIKHAYERIDTESTCTQAGSIKFVTDCPCGENLGTSHKVFTANVTSSSTYTLEDYTDREKEMLPHNLAASGTVEYCDGYTKPGYFTYKCSMCKQGIKEGEATFPPLVKCYGYSVSEADGTGALSVKYCIDESALRTYQFSNGRSIEYGSVVALKKSLGDNTPLDSKGAARAGVIKLKASSSKYSTNTIKLTSLGDAQKTLSYVMSMYIIDGGEVHYIQDTETVTNPSGITYKEVKDLADYYESLTIALPVSVGDED